MQLARSVFFEKFYAEHPDRVLFRGRRTGQQGQWTERLDSYAEEAMRTVIHVYGGYSCDMPNSSAKWVREIFEAIKEIASGEPLKAGVLRERLTRAKERVSPPTVTRAYVRKRLMEMREAGDVAWRGYSIHVDTSVEEYAEWATPLAFRKIVGDVPVDTHVRYSAWYSRLQAVFLHNSGNDVKADDLLKVL